MSLFDDLKDSLQEAVDSKNGQQVPVRVSQYEVADVKAIREKSNVSRSDMAQVHSTSVDTI